jgi:hypothetical protein
LQAAPRQHMNIVSASSPPANFFDSAATLELGRQQRLLCALLSVRLQATQQRGTPCIQRQPSADSMVTVDYYSTEAKKLRKRRRSVQAESYGQGQRQSQSQTKTADARYSKGIAGSV